MPIDINKLTVVRLREEINKRGKRTIKASDGWVKKDLLQMLEKSLQKERDNGGTGLIEEEKPVVEGVFTSRSRSAKRKQDGKHHYPALGLILTVIDAVEEEKRQKLLPQPDAPGDFGNGIDVLKQIFSYILATPRENGPQHRHRGYQVRELWIQDLESDFCCMRLVSKLWKSAADEVMVVFQPRGVIFEVIKKKMWQSMVLLYQLKTWNRETKTSSHMKR